MAVREVEVTPVSANVTGAAGGHANCTCVFGPKPDPVITTVTFPSPALRFGILIVTEPTGRVNGPDRTPSGVSTVNATLPVCVSSDAGTTAVNCVAPLNVVGTDCPFQLTVTPSKKFRPVIVIVVDAAPTAIELGLTESITGTGRTINGRAFDTCPFGLLTLTCTVPAATIADAGTLTVREVVRPNPDPEAGLKRLSPNRTVAPGKKPLPVTVKSKPCAVAVLLSGFNEKIRN